MKYQLLSVGSVSIFGPFELNLESFHSNLESVHGMNGGLSRGRVVKGNKSKTFGLIGCSINEYFGTDYISEWKEHLYQFSITKFLWKVIYEQITPFGPFTLWLRRYCCCYGTIGYTQRWWWQPRMVTGSSGGQDLCKLTSIGWWVISSWRFKRNVM